MNYKDIAVKNEQRLKQKNLRWATLLYNAVVLLEEQYNPLQLQDENNADIFEDVHEYLLDELGMTEEEYKEIME